MGDIQGVKTMNRFDINLPITTTEECENALWYVEGQLYKISSLIKKIVDNETTIKFAITNRLSESDLSNELDLYKKTAKEIRECRANVDVAATCIREFLKNNEIDPNSLIFENIEQWTSAVETHAKRYDKMLKKSKNSLPSISGVCSDYSASIAKLNEIQVRRPVFN